MLELISFIALGSGLSAAGAFLFGRHRYKPKTIVTENPTLHQHKRWKKGDDSLYFCIECGDRYLDGRPPK